MFDGIRHIKAFLTVARLGNFTRASQELHVSQPALTVQIQQLESSLGVRLLHRDKSRNQKQVSVTQAGQDLMARLEHILNDVESIMQTGRDFAELRRGVVTVAAMPSIASTLFPQALCRYSESHPGVVVRLKDAMGKQVAKLVKTGVVDFGVGWVAKNDRSVVTEHLLHERLCAFTSKSHPLAKKTTITLRELSKHRIILPEMHTSVRVTLERALKQQQLQCRPVHETSHLSETIGLVNAGLGVAILPVRAVEGYPSAELRQIAITEPILEREVVIIGKTGRPFSAAARKLIEILHQVAGDFPDDIDDGRGDSGTRHPHSVAAL